jgi:hypothetical protein
VVLHAPVEQTLPCGQMAPHSPQLPGSNCVLVHTPPHIVWPTVHPAASGAFFAFPAPPQPAIARRTNAQTKPLPRFHRFIKTVMRFAPIRFEGLATRGSAKSHLIAISWIAEHKRFDSDQHVSLVIVGVQELVAHFAQRGAQELFVPPSSRKRPLFTSTSPLCPAIAGLRTDPTSCAAARSRTGSAAQ